MWFQQTHISVLNTVLSEGQKSAPRIAFHVTTADTSSHRSSKISWYLVLNFLKMIQSIELQCFFLGMFPWICVSGRKFVSFLLSLEPGVVLQNLPEIIWHLAAVGWIPEGVNSEQLQGPAVADCVERKAGYSDLRLKNHWPLVSCNPALKSSCLCTLTSARLDGRPLSVFIEVGILGSHFHLVNQFLFQGVCISPRMQF